MKRSLLMAGGGLKVAAQAGVLQVWLDEIADSTITFDHADAASGGCMNLAMWCQGLSGTQIANHWRTFRPMDIVSVNVPGTSLGHHFGALLTMKALREKQFTRWRLDWPGIRASRRVGTFNVYDFTAHALTVIPNADITEDLTVAAMSLPQWFPPIEVAGHTFTDAVFVTDANVEEAIRRGADEIWVIWTVSRKSEWRRFGVNQYFDIVEISANGNLRRDLDRVKASNDSIAAGRRGQYCRKIEIKELHIEVPLNYVLNTRASKFPLAVDLGVRKAREWCRANNIRLGPEKNGSTWRRAVHYNEAMTGSMTFGNGGGKANLSLELRVVMHDPVQPLGDDGLSGDLTGWVRCEGLGGRLRIIDSRFIQFCTVAGHREMRYWLVFRDGTDRMLTLYGVKTLSIPGKFAQSLKLAVRVFDGAVLDLPGSRVPIATGELTVSWRAAVRLVLSFRAQGKSWWTKLHQTAAYLKHYLSAV